MPYIAIACNCNNFKVCFAHQMKSPRTKSSQMATIFQLHKMIRIAGPPMCLETSLVHLHGIKLKSYPREFAELLMIIQEAALF